MRAKQGQNQNEPQHSDHAEALSLASDLWSWLGEKTRYRDLVEGWIPLITRAREEAGLDWDRMRTVVRWAALENEYTVTNLRVSRDPGGSLFVNQWENVVVFFEADEAAQLARARKKWKNGACSQCDVAEAKLNNHNSLCDKCDEKRRQLVASIMRMIEAVSGTKVFTYDSQTLRWAMYDRPSDQEGATELLAGEHPFQFPTNGGEPFRPSRERRIQNIAEQIALDERSYAALVEFWEAITKEESNANHNQ